MGGHQGGTTYGTVLPDFWKIEAHPYDILSPTPIVEKITLTETSVGYIDDNVPFQLGKNVWWANPIKNLPKIILPQTSGVRNCLRGNDLEEKDEYNCLLVTKQGYYLHEPQYISNELTCDKHPDDHVNALKCRLVADYKHDYIWTKPNLSELPGFDWYKLLELPAVNQATLLGLKETTTSDSTLKSNVVLPGKYKLWFKMISFRKDTTFEVEYRHELNPTSYTAETYIDIPLVVNNHALGIYGLTKLT